jgi:site-specific DNA recombinase
MRAAIYARYSTDDQRATSIDDQVRRCHETATREGIDIDPAFVFSDDAVSGSSKGKGKRPGYQQLLDAIEAGEVRTVVVDELSRLTRDVEEGGRLMTAVEQCGLQIIAANGLDTRQKGWQASFMVSILMSKLEVEGLSHRTTRGMLGQLERGFMVAQAPLGFQRVKDLDAKGEPIGTRWVIDEAKAEVVRQVFAWRYEGLSGNEIARRLQSQGIPLPRVNRCKGAPCWRPGNVFRLLQNSIYRGVFVWNGSHFSKSKARRLGITLDELEFERPECRLVTDEVWHACNTPSQNARRLRGGGKHLLSGLIACGDCSAKLSISGSAPHTSLYCPQCETLVRVGGKTRWVGYSSASAAMHALQEVLRQLLTAEFKAEFQRRLRQRLSQNSQPEVEQLDKELAALEARKTHVKRLLLSPHLDPAEFEQEYEKLGHQIEALKRRRMAVSAQGPRVTSQEVEQQLAVDPAEALRELMDGTLPAYRVRAVLGRLMTEFALIARPMKGKSVFRIALKPGVFLAEIAAGKVLDTSATVYQVAVSVGAARPPVWQVECKKVTE